MHRIVTTTLIAAAAPASADIVLEGMVRHILAEAEFDGFQHGRGHDFDERLATGPGPFDFAVDAGVDRLSDGAASALAAQTSEISALGFWGRSGAAASLAILDGPSEGLAGAISTFIVDFQVSEAGHDDLAASISYSSVDGDRVSAW